MGRYRIGPEEEDDDDGLMDDINNDADGMHQEEDEPSGIWRGPLIQMTQHCPQNFSNNGNSSHDNNGMDLASPHSEEGTLSFAPPSVSIRPPRRHHSHYNDVDTHAVGFHPAYYEYDYPPPKPPPSSLFSWKNMILFALVAHLVARYGPAAPPLEADSETWEAFWTRELCGLWRTTKLVTYVVPKYVLEWIMVGLWDDAHYYYQRYQSYASMQQQLEFWSHCSLVISNVDDWNLEYTTTTATINHNHHPFSYYEYQIVGQSRAVQVSAQAVDAWTQSSPLLLYFAGSRGVGKLELARQIGQRVFGHCMQNNNSNNNDTSDVRMADTSNYLFSNAGSPVLVLQGRDFSTSVASKEASLHDGDSSLEDEEDEGARSTQQRKAMDSAAGANANQHVGSSARAVRVELYETVLRHTQQHPNGTVVILQHAEGVVEGLVASLVQDLTNPSPHVSQLDRANSHGDEGQPQQSLAARLQKACSRTIFILTSNIGSKTIASSIRSYGGISIIPPLELDLMLMHELDMRYATSNVEVGSKFHAVAPFYPLELPSMANILTQKVHQWARKQSQLIHGFPGSWEVTLSGSNALLDSYRVEYLSMVKKSTQTPILTFSSSGAHILREGSPMMNSWQASVRRCFRERPSKGEDDGVKDEDATTDDENNQPKLLLAKEKAILDYDPTTREAIVSTSLCLKAAETCESTKELCRFSL